MCAFRFALCALAVVASAQTGPAPAVGPRFQYAAITGSANVLTISRVPVVNSSGQTVYQDITIQFDSDGDGNLTMSAGYPTATTSPNLLVSSFQAGRYQGPKSIASGKAAITVSGPGVVSGGATAWSLASTSDSDACTYPVSATWYVGPIENNPMAGRLKKAGITSTAWSYGVSGGGVTISCGSSSFFNWGNGAIVGVSQTGNTITFASFTNNSFDKDSPVDQVTYTLNNQ